MKVENVDWGETSRNGWNEKEGLKNAKEMRKKDGRMRRRGKRWNGRWKNEVAMTKVICIGN